MTETWKEKWDQRYASDEFAYGVQPNQYLKDRLESLTPGEILFPAEGEGRNAVFAAQLGWKVWAFDISAEGQKKAEQLAATNNVSIDYRVGELGGLDYQVEQFDAIALIYAHFPAEIKFDLHKSLDKYLRKGGMIIFEAFSKSHLKYLERDPNVGGPKDVESLFSKDEVLADFNDYDVIELEEVEINLNEGIYHNGVGSVIRFLGRKK